MAQIGMVPVGKSQRAVVRPGSARARLVLVTPPSSESGQPAESAAAPVVTSRAELVGQRPPAPTRSVASAESVPRRPPASPAVGGRHAVLRGAVRPGQLLRTPSAPARPLSEPAHAPTGRTAPLPARPASAPPSWEAAARSAVWSKDGPAPRRRPARAPIRLTTRGRAVVVALLLVPLLAALSLLFRAQVDASSDTTAPGSYPVVVVQPGETLWTIADRIAPDRDPRDVIYQIREINGLPDASIQSGQRLAVPSG